mmetsp:Transcript_180563/g.572886  ORF Transcript_180563/g.572886 Transcript_180563/m.572886 type:complete len:218 (-) Transcript_180563:216-869(-)
MTPAELSTGPPSLVHHPLACSSSVLWSLAPSSTASSSTCFAAEMSPRRSSSGPASLSSSSSTCFAADLSPRKSSSGPASLSSSSSTCFAAELSPRKGSWGPGSLLSMLSTSVSLLVTWLWLRSTLASVLQMRSLSRLKMWPLSMSTSLLKSLRVLQQGRWLRFWSLRNQGARCRCFVPARHSRAKCTMGLQAPSHWTDHRRLSQGRRALASTGSSPL